MQIRIGIAGLGRMGKIHALNLAHSIQGVVLVAVCSNEQQHLQWAMRHLPAHHQYQSFAEMLTNPELDAIVIASPSAFHPAQIETCVNAGLHIFCEKPIAIDQQGVDRMMTLQKRRLKTIVQIGFMRRFDTSCLRAKSIIDQGKIGKPILYRGYSADSIKFIKESIRGAAQSAGQFLDMAIHDIDLMRWYLDAEPSQVTAYGGCYAFAIFEQHQDADNVAAFFQMENATMAFLYAGRTAAHGYLVESEIIGTQGIIRVGVQPNADFVEVVNEGGRSQLYYQDFEERFTQAFLAEMKTFCRAIQQYDMSITNLDDSIKATRIALGATQAFKTNELVRF
ncbi:MAG: Gfo/Idh/MocA family oxidoreductase [Saprospiraceae bacterium]|nr:Gfo/Idh/MocA family oxidoreductase [Saprospiraceae bacterium]